MTPVKQTVRHLPEKGQAGDCYRCCIASILDVPAQSVPHFWSDTRHTHATEEEERARRAWFDAAGLVRIEVAFDEGSSLANVQAWARLRNPGVHYILHGSSGPCNHSVVGLDDKIVWCPMEMKNPITGPLRPDGNFRLEFIARKL